MIPRLTSLVGVCPAASLSAASTTPAPFLRWRRSCRPEQRRIVAVVLAHKFHHLVDARPNVSIESLRRAPRSRGEPRIFVNDFIEDPRTAHARETLDRMKLFARLLDTAYRVFSVEAN